MRAIRRFVLIQWIDFCFYLYFLIQFDFIYDTSDANGGEELRHRIAGFGYTHDANGEATTLECKQVYSFGRVLSLNTYNNARLIGLSWRASGENNRNNKYITQRTAHNRMDQMRVPGIRLTALWEQSLRGLQYIYFA